MKKRLTRIISIIIIIFFTINGIGVSRAESNQYKINYTKSTSVLKWDTAGLVNPYVTYGDEGENIAYCLNPKKPGAEEFDEDYYVQIKNKITDLGLWRVFANGYPIKTFPGLSKQEAYEATLEAIHCYTDYFQEEKYSAENSNELIREDVTVKQSGEKVISAMKQILRNAENDTRIIPSSSLDIEERRLGYNRR